MYRLTYLEGRMYQELLAVPAVWGLFGGLLMNFRRD